MNGWNLNGVERAFADGAVNPSRWVEAIEFITKEAGDFGTVLLPASGNAIPDICQTQSLMASSETYYRDGWHLRDERDRPMKTFIDHGVVDDFDCMDADQMKRHSY